MAEHEYYEVNGRQIRVRPTESGQEIDEYGNFHRQPNHFTKGFGEGENPVEADRYILFWGKGCNWSNRASIARELEMEFGEDKAGDEYILVLDGIHPVSTCRLHQLDENTGKIERVATLKEYRGQHYGAVAITAAEEWFAERGVKKIFINSRTEAVGFYEKLGYVADPKQITGTGAFQCIMTEKQL